jgi:diacylglycerol O-acyltransferase
VAAHLTPLDAAFLELEEADESAHMHIGWAMVFEPLPGGGTPSLEDVQQRTAERLEALPRFRRRLSSQRVGSFSLPSWEPDPGFDVANHIRHATLPAPGDDAELLDWLGDFYSHRLDRAHPLWEMTLLDGFEDGSWALATKIHHCLVDGLSGVSVATVLLDAEPDPAPGDTGLAAALEPPDDDAADHNGRGRLSRLIGALGGGAETAVDAALHPRKLAEALSRSRAMAEMVIREELIGAPHTSINVRIGGTRRLAVVETQLDEIKQVKRELGGTVNDVVLAVTAGGLRRLFEQRKEGSLADSVRAMVPVSLRRASEALALGNRVTSLFVDLPLAEPDPLLRFHKTVAAAEELKDSDMGAGAQALIELAGSAPPLIHSVVARLAFTPRLFNITITNVPGPPSTFYGFGSPLRRVIPLVPIFSGHAVGVAVVSYDGKVSFGLNGDRVRVPDLEAFKEGIEESLTDLKKLASNGGAPAKAEKSGSRDAA